MKYQVVINPEFKISFNEAYNYIRNTLKAKIAAKNLRKKMQECIKNLSTIPEAYPKLDNLKVENHQLRFCNCKNFTISFAVVGNKVYIYNFFYSKSQKHRNKNQTDDN